MMEDRRPEAMKIVHRYMAFSAGAALIPFTGFDVAALAGIHVALIKELCDHYDVDFTEHTARNVLIGVAGSIVPGTVGSIVGKKILGMLPVASAMFGWTLMSAGSAAFSYAIGRLFIEHFEGGGTLLSFDHHRMHAVTLPTAT
jgi:uncharacterized protein (DUF697 family)